MEKTQFEESLEESKKTLQDCQKQNNLQTCLLCPKVIECPTRLEYVKNVFLFLNQGQSESDFDF